MGVGPGAQRHAAGVDQGHENQPHRFKLPVQRAVPLQAHDETLQIGNHDTRADALQPMHAAKIADRRHLERRVAQCDDMNRIAGAAGQIDLAHNTRFKPARPQLNNALHGLQFR